ncbi:MAG: hypothetical protein OEZ02_02405 [Anaerolineae bacterium]|nr:hypothetical protein [Anaerolineae bacterium]
MTEHAAISTIAGGIAARLRSLVTLLDRVDRLEAGSGSWLASFPAQELPAAAQELSLRALRTAADPANFAVLQALAASSSQPIQQLVAATGIGRLALSEKLNDLVQVGFASRMIDTDHAQITAAGAQMAALVEGIIGEVQTLYAKNPRDP